MADQKYNFQYCPKLVLFNDDWTCVLLARRYGEADYDGTFSFIGGKVEATDGGILAGIRREKCEEIGSEAHVMLYLDVSRNYFFRKQDGSVMVLPHHVARYTGGEIVLNADEYSEYRWVPIAEVTAVQPLIPNIPDCVTWALAQKAHLTDGDYVKL